MNLSNELGISKNRKIEILLEMGYEKCGIVNELYRYPKKSGTGHWFQSSELNSFFYSDDNFKEFVRYKLIK